MLRDKAEEQSASNRSEERLSYMIVLNDMEVSSEYILKLKAELEVRLLPFKKRLMCNLRLILRSSVSEASELWHRRRIKSRPVFWTYYKQAKFVAFAFLSSLAIFKFWYIRLF